jgi:6-phosphogluconolactonase (cycloisomerase 2 family)
MAMKVRVLLSLVVVLLGMCMAGCGHYTCGTTFGNATCSSSGTGITTGPPGTGSGLVAYGYFTSFALGGQSSVGIATQKLDAGAGTVLSLSSLVAPVIPPFPSGIVIVRKQFMYVPSMDGTLYIFSIDSATGALAAVGTTVPISVTGGDSIAASPDGNWIFVGDTAGQRISVYKINTDGTLTGATGNPFATSGISPKVMATDGQSKFLYASGGKGSTQVAAFSIGSGGVLGTVAGSPFVASLNSMAGDPSGKFLLGVSWASSDKSIQVYSIGSGGGLTALSSAITINTPRTITMHPSGKWVYTGNEDPLLSEVQFLEGFNFNSATGTLTEMGGSPFTDVLANEGLIEQTGTFMIALGFRTTGSSVLIAKPLSIDQTTGEVASWPSGTGTYEGFVGIDAAAYAVTDSQ